MVVWKRVFHQRVGTRRKSKHGSWVRVLLTRKSIRDSRMLDVVQETEWMINHTKDRRKESEQIQRIKVHQE